MRRNKTLPALFFYNSAMKLHPDARSGLNSITACGPGFVTVSGRRCEHSLVVTPDLLDPDWPVAGVGDLAPATLAGLLDHGCDFWLLGTGNRQVFPPPASLHPLIEARVGIEVMDTAAACRTYNILAAEGRKVGAALIVEPA